MMKLPIPDDWNGNEWRCVQIVWPDSPQWIALLVGFLSQPRRGRFWDEKSGSIRDVQEIGDQIFYDNFPFKTCGGDVINENGQVIFSGSSGITVLGGDDMGQVVTDVYIDDKTGELVVNFGKCCEFRYTLATGMAGDTVEKTIDNPYPPEQDYSACGKATAAVDLMFDVGQAFWDEKDNYPWHWTKDITAKFPHLTMGKTGIYLGVTNAIELNVLDYEHSSIFSTSAKKSMTCAVMGHMEDDFTTPENLKDLMHGIVQSEFGWDIPLVAFWGSAIEAIGNNDLRDHALTGATNTDAVCECSGNLDSLPTEPTTSGWYLSAPMPLASGVGPEEYNYHDFVTLAVAEHDIYGMTFRLRHDSGGALGKLKRQNDPDLTVTYDVYMHQVSSEFLDDDTLYAQMPTTVYAEVFPDSGAVRLDLGVNSDSINNPPVTKNQIIQSRIGFWSADDQNPMTGTLEEVRWLHNTNSPSHL